MSEGVYHRVPDQVYVDGQPDAEDGEDQDEQCVAQGFSVKAEDQEPAGQQYAGGQQVDESHSSAENPKEKILDPGDAGGNDAQQYQTGGNQDQYGLPFAFLFHRTFKESG